MKCEYCDILDRKSTADILYEDNDIVIAIKDFSIAPGQITVFPKQHFTIMEMVPDDILQKCFTLANKVSVAIFESMGAHGTNIIVQNGLGAGQKVPHFAVEIIPRREGDGLNLQWAPKELSEDEKETSYLLIKEEGDKLVDIGKKKEKKEVSQIVTEKISGLSGKDNYLLKSLKRIP
jgi:histidine triad (HIT) family protein